MKPGVHERKEQAVQTLEQRLYDITEEIYGALFDELVTFLLRNDFIVDLIKSAVCYLHGKGIDGDPAYVPPSEECSLTKKQS